MKALVCLYMVDIKIAHDRRDMCCNISNIGCTDTTKLPNTINKYTAGAPTLPMLPLDLKDALKTKLFTKYIY